MKKFNKSKIMKLAHHLMKYEGFDRSTALTLAWDKARYDSFYLIIEVRKPRNLEYNQMNYANSLTNYYAKNSYNGD